MSVLLPTVGGVGQTVDNDRCWRIEWNPIFYRFCRATGGNLLFDLAVYRMLTPASRRLFLKLKDRFWRTKRVFMNVDDLTINGLGFSASRPLKKRKFDLLSCIRELLDHHVVNRSRGRLGQDNSTLLGSLLLTAIEQAAMTRADLPERERRDHFLYLDEFQSLTTPSTAIMLSESRKYRLCLTLSHQLTRQLDPETYRAVIGNCGTLLSFRVGLEDAELLAPAMSKHPGQLTSADLCNLPNYTAFARLLIDGHPSRPFSLRTLPPDAMAFDELRADIVRRTSQHRYGRPAQQVERAIERAFSA